MLLAWIGTDMRHVTVSMFLTCTLVAFLPIARSEELPSTPEKLVELLASPNEPLLGFYHSGEPRPEMPVTDRRVWQAKEALERLGTAAFPTLIVHRSDSRYSYSYVPGSASLVLSEGAMIWHNRTVGDVCVEIITNQVNAGEEYKGCHYYMPECVSSDRLPAWWSARSSRSLAELQREAMEWTIAREKRDAVDPGNHFAEFPSGRVKQLETAYRSKCQEKKADANNEPP